MCGFEQAHGVRAPDERASSIKQLPLFETGLTAAKADAARCKVVRDWLGGAASPQQQPEPPPSEPFDLPVFAATVRALAASSPPEDRFHDNKVFIAALWRASQREPNFPRVSLAEFKQRLVEANSQDLLHLSRADLVQAMDPQLVAESETDVSERDVPLRPARRGPSMSTVVAPVESPAAADPRMAAFLAPDCPEVFHSVATPTAIWKADPYDVETIHAEARAAFEHVLNRAGRTPPPPSGAVLVLLGEAGSGKTHLMRAFRTRAHGQGLGLLRLPPDDDRGEQLRSLHADQPDRRPGAAVRPRRPVAHRARPVVGGVAGVGAGAVRD